MFVDSFDLENRSGSIKDNVGRCGCDLLWVPLNLNNSLDFQGIKAYHTWENSPFSYLFTETRYNFLLEGP